MTNAETLLLAAMEAVEVELADAPPMQRLRINGYLRLTLRDFRELLDGIKEEAEAVK